MDLAIIVVPAAVVPAVADECGQKGVKGLIVVSAGFKEVGPEGAALELELLEVVRKWEMRMVGPNCLGIFNADDAVRLNATFAPGTPLSGPVGFVSQSGRPGHRHLDRDAEARGRLLPVRLDRQQGRHDR